MIALPLRYSIPGAVGHQRRGVDLNRQQPIMIANKGQLRFFERELKGRGVPSLVS